jgi:nitrilase
MGDEFPRVRVAAVHSASVFLDRERSVDKACGLIAEAGKEGARLIAFPETYVPGYPFWIWTHTPRLGAPLFAEFFRNAVEIPSNATEQLGEAARKAGAWVVVGVSERDGGTLYNTLVYFDDQGRLVARHRKLQPTHVERTVWGRGDGRDVFVLETPFGRLGGLICFEHSMDLNRYSLTALGEQIHIAAWPGISALSHDPNSSNFDNISDAAARYHAIAAQAFVINVQSRIDEATIERLGFADQPDMLRVGGGWSAIVAPNGQLLAGPNRDDEAILYAELDLGDIVLGKYFCDSAGHYARPDIFRFGIERRGQTVLSDPSQEQLAAVQPSVAGDDAALLYGDLRSARVLVDAGPD